MSSALGPVDENRLRLSQQGRAILAERERQAAAERQRMEEQRRREEAERRREEAERRAAEEKQRQESTPRNRNIVFVEGKGWEFIVTPTYEDPFGKRPVTKEEINPAFLASPEGAEVKASFEAAEAAAKAGQDKAIQEQIQQSISDFIGTSKAAGVVPRDIKAYYDEKTNMINIEGSNFYPVRSELSPPSQPKSSVGAPIVDEDFPILTPAPGLRGRGVFTGSTSAGRTETVIIGKEQQPGKEIVTVDTQKTLSDRIEYSKSAFEIPISAGEPDAGYLTPVSGRPGVYEEVGPFGTFRRTAIIQTDKPLDQVKPYEDSAVQQIVVSKQVEMVKVPPAEIKVEGGFAGGFSAYGENLAKTPVVAGELLATGKQRTEFKPEVEAMFIDSLIDVGRGVAERKSFAETTGRLGYNLQNIGDFIIKNPEYAAGSLAASALFTVGTLGFGKAMTAARVGSNILKGTRGAKAAELEGRMLAREVGIVTRTEPVIVTAQQVSKAGELLPLKARGPVYTVGKDIKLPTLVRREVAGVSGSIEAAPAARQLDFGLKLKPGIAKTTIEKATAPDVFIVEKGIEEAAFVGAKKSGRVAVVTSGLGEAEKTRLAKSPMVEAITDVYQSESKVLPRVSVPVVSGTVEKTPGAIVVQAGKTIGKVAESKPINISIVTAKRKDIQKILQGEARERKLQEAAAKKLGTIPESKATKSSFEIAAKPIRAAKTSKTPLENITVRVLDRELQDIGKKAAVIIATEGTAKESQIIGKIGLGGGAAIYGAKAGVIGFGGATGAEKAADKNLTVDVETQYLTTPPGAKETSKSLIDVKPLEAPTQKTGQRADTSVTGELAKALVPKLDVGGKLAVNLVGGQMSVTKQESRPIITVKPLSLTGTRQQTRQQSRQAQRSTQLFRHATRTPTRPPRPPKRGAERKKRRKLDVDIDWDGRSVGLGVKSVFSPRKRLGQFDILPEGKKARKRFLKL